MSFTGKFRDAFLPPHRGVISAKGRRLMLASWWCNASSRRIHINVCTLWQGLPGGYQHNLRIDKLFRTLYDLFSFNASSTILYHFSLSTSVNRCSQTIVVYKGDSTIRRFQHPGCLRTFAGQRFFHHLWSNWSVPFHQLSSGLMVIRISFRDQPLAFLLSYASIQINERCCGFSAERRRS